MTIQKTNHYFKTIGKKIMPVFVMLFLFSTFSAKADFATFYKVYLNDSLIRTIQNDEVGTAQVAIPYWEKSDTLRIYQCTDFGHSAVQFVFYSNAYNLLAVVNSLEITNVEQTCVKFSPTELPKENCKVCFRIKCLVDSSLPYKEYYLFDLIFPEQK